MSCLKVSTLLNKAIPICSRSLTQSRQIPAMLGANTSRLIHCGIPAFDVYYSKDHEWVKVEGDVGIIGVSDHAQKELGEVVFCELPEVDAEFDEGDVFGSVESVKAASDMVMPVSGTVCEINEQLSDDPSLINSSPEGDGWIIKVKLSEMSQLKELMNPEAYKEFTD